MVKEGRRRLGTSKDSKYDRRLKKQKNLNKSESLDGLSLYPDLLLRGHNVKVYKERGKGKVPGKV